MGQSGCPTTAQEITPSTIALDTALSPVGCTGSTISDRVCQGFLQGPGSLVLEALGIMNFPVSVRKKQTGLVVNMMVQGRTEDAQS